MCEPRQNPYKMWTIGKDGYAYPLIKTDISEQYNQPRQKLPVAYWQNGYIDVTRAETIMRKNSMTGDHILPLIVDSTNFIDIDDEMTFRQAEIVYSMRNKKV